MEHLARYQYRKYLLLIEAGLVVSFLVYPSFSSGQANPPQQALEKANTLLKQGQAESAESIYRQLLKSSPKSLAARLALGRIALRKGDYLQARQQFERALADHPDSAEAAAELGYLFRNWSSSPFEKATDYQARAEEHLKQALLINGMSAPALTYYAEWWLDRGDTVSAERYLNQALEADPKFVPTYQAYTRFYMKVNDLRRAKQTMLHAIELDPENSRSYYQMAELLALAGHPEEAVKYAVKSEELDFGNNLERDHFLAQQHEKLGDAPKALEYYNRVMTFSPDHVPTLMRVADLMDSLGQPQQSMSFYKKAMSLEPALLAQLIDQARTALRKEKTEEALRLWRRVLSLKPGDDEALHALASAHYVNYFYKQSKPDVLQSDIALFEREADNALSPLLKVDRLKLEIAVQNGLNETVRQQLNVLAAEQDALASGEALFLLGQYLKAQDRLDAADGETGQDYLNIADRLLLDQELVSSAALYQRGYQLERLPALKEGMDRIKAKRDLAEKRIQEGNVLVSEKKPAEAVTKYQEASQIYREWDIPYMRLGDTYERLNKDREAFEAYREAVQLTPSLLDSKGFSKKYEKLNKKFSKVTQTKPAE